MLMMVISTIISNLIFTMIDTYNFTGDGVTVLGMVGVISTAIIIFTAFRRYYNSPLRK
jgi:hypothetical protein|tara:strand:+ start:413 stop:586 length:174 start_codon:yes stop_codon:yes gene_type:complete